MKQRCLNDELILKRNDQYEREFKYKKIYDLSKIDEIPFINPTKKYSLLSSIKKILLCTNKYIDICNKNELFQYISVSMGIFILYISIISPFYEIIVLSEQRVNKLGNYNVINKLWHYWIGQLSEILFRIIFNYLRKRKTKKLMLYYAENELNKIRDEFNIAINESNFDVIIKYKKSKYNNDFIDYERNFQYVICYPNVRYYNWDETILNEKEKKIIEELKSNIKIYENNFLLKNCFHSVILLVLYLFIFFFLTNKNLILYYIFIFIFFSYTKIVSFFLSSKYKQNLIFIEQFMNFKKNIMINGYLIILNSCVIHIFKLNPIEYYQGKKLEEIYIDFSEKVEKLNNKYSILSFL